MSILIPAISFYCSNDTPSFVTWPSRLATAPVYWLPPLILLRVYGIYNGGQFTAPDAPTCTVIHGGQFTGGVHPPTQFVPEIVSPLPCLPALARHTLLIDYFFKELISFFGSLDKCHTSVFNALT